jgi:hypothetical protein
VLWHSIATKTTGTQLPRLVNIQRFDLLGLSRQQDAGMQQLPQGCQPCLDFGQAQYNTRKWSMKFMLFTLFL